MPPVVVVFGLPVADHDLGVDHRPEDIDVEAFVAQPAVERFDVAVAPRLAWWDKRQADTVVGPVGHRGEGVVASLVERFNSGKVSAMMALYEPEAVFVVKDGRTVTGHTDIAAQLEPDLRYGLPLKAKARHAFVAGDIAQIVLDWSIDGVGPDGKHVHL